MSVLTSKCAPRSDFHYEDLFFSKGALLDDDWDVSGYVLIVSDVNYQDTKPARNDDTIRGQST